MFVVHAEQTATPLNDNVILDASTDGGLTFTQSFTLNGSNNRHRYLPWVCATGSQVYASWYDMRAASAANNSLDVRRRLSDRRLCGGAGHGHE